MASISESKEFQQLGQFFKQLQRKCEFQNVSFGDKIKQDIGLSDKYTKFQQLGKKIRQHKSQKIENAQNNSVISEDINLPPLKTSKNITTISQA